MSIQKTYINKIDAINYPILPKEYRKYPTMNLDDAYEKGWTDLQEFLSNQMEENVVEVIRCEQCIKSYPHLNGRWCKVYQTMMRNVDYCSSGEHKDE